MIHPSYTELIDVLSKQEDLDESMLSRYTIIIAAAKRARQIVDGSEVLISNVKVDKACFEAGCLPFSCFYCGKRAL